MQRQVITTHNEEKKLPSSPDWHKKERDKWIKCAFNADVVELWRGISRKFDEAKDNKITDILTMNKLTLYKFVKLNYKHKCIIKTI